MHFVLRFRANPLMFIVATVDGEGTNGAEKKHESRETMITAGILVLSLHLELLVHRRFFMFQLTCVMLSY